MPRNDRDDRQVPGAARRDNERLIPTSANGAQFAGEFDRYLDTLLDRALNEHEESCEGSAELSSASGK
jgi:hypothetical protein